MCGIVGLFLKKRALEPELGAWFSEMLICMSSRGPDSAVFAIYGESALSGPRLLIQISISLNQAPSSGSSALFFKNRPTIPHIEDVSYHETFISQAKDEIWLHSRS